MVYEPLNTIGIAVAGDPPTLGRLGPIALIVTCIILLRIFAGETS